MGLNKFILSKLNELSILDFSTKKNAIVIGEQQISRCCGIKDASLFKNFLSKNGWTAQSIDLGNHPVYKTAIKLDLATALPDEFHDKYDILFDFGTGEHIRNQSIYWENCHKIVRNDGVRIHVLPPPNTWPRHCKYRYSLSFFEKLCQEFQYDILDVEQIGNGSSALIFCYFKNGKKVFDTSVFIDKVMPEIEIQKNFVDAESL
jgi:hypothetical protein